MIRKSIMNNLNSEYVDSELILFINIEIQLSNNMIIKTIITGCLKILKLKCFLFNISNKNQIDMKNDNATNLIDKTGSKVENDIMIGIETKTSCKNVLNIVIFYISNLTIFTLTLCSYCSCNNHMYI